MVLSDSLRIARLQALADAMAGGTLTLYTAPQPATGAAITTQAALVALSIPSGLTVSTPTLPLTLASTGISTSGDAAWGRITSSSHAFVLDGDCGLVTSSALFRLKFITLTATGNLNTVISTFSEA